MEIIFHSHSNKNAISSVESRLFVDKIRSEEANRAQAFVTRGVGGRGAPHIKGPGGHCHIWAI